MEGFDIFSYFRWLELGSTYRGKGGKKPEETKRYLKKHKVHIRVTLFLFLLLTNIFSIP